MLDHATGEAIKHHRGALLEAVAAQVLMQRGQRPAASIAPDLGQPQVDEATHLQFLADAVGASAPELFVEHVGWAKILQTHLGRPVEDLAQNLTRVQRALQQVLPAELAAVACRYVEAGLRQLAQLPPELATFLDAGAALGQLAREYLSALLDGDRNSARRLINDAVQSGVPVKDIYLEVFQRSQYEVGRLWQMNRISVAQEHYCTAATQLIMSSLYPHIFTTTRLGRTLVAACVSGDLHEIGLRMVSDLFEIEGWDTYYVGANTPTAGIVDAVVRRKAAVLGLSATMISNVPAIADVIEAVRASDKCHEVRILVGGYPFNVATDLWHKVGADGTAGDAAEAIVVGSQLLERCARHG